MKILSCDVRASIGERVYVGVCAVCCVFYFLSYVWMDGCLYVCMCVSMCVCMDVCMYA